MKALFKSVLLDFDKIRAEQILLDYGRNDKELIYNIISETLTELGDEWANGELALSQIYMTSRICEEVIDKIFNTQQIDNRNNPPIGIVTLGDYHLLGKKIVSSAMRSCGFNIIDFGSISQIAELIDKIIINKTNILLISTLMQHSALRIKEVKEAISQLKLETKILVGGAPFIFDSQLWQQVGADGMGRTPADAIRIVNQWIRRD